MCDLRDLVGHDWVQGDVSGCCTADKPLHGVYVWVGGCSKCALYHVPCIVMLLRRTDETRTILQSYLAEKRCQDFEQALKL